MSGDDQDTTGTTPADGTDTPTDTGGTDTSAPSGDTGGTDTSSPSGDTGGTDTSSPSGDTGGTDTSAPSGDTGGTDTSSPSGGTGGTDTSAPSDGTGGTDTSAPSGDTGSPSGGTGGTDTSSPSGGTGGTDTSAPSGDTGSPSGGTGGTDTSSPSGGTGGTDTSSPSGGTGGTDTSAPSGDTGGTSGDTGSTSGDTGSGDGSTGSGDTSNAGNNSSGGTGSGGSASGNGSSGSGGTGSGSSSNSAGSASPDPNDPSPSGGWFKDGKQLSDALNDAKTVDVDNVVASKAADAQAILDKFIQSTATNPWKGLSRQIVGNRLKAIVANSRLIKQGNLNLCGPAAFFVCWAKRDPVAFANYATTLFDTGKSAVGKMAVVPASGMLAQDYNAIASTTGTEQADWLVMGALKGSNEFFWQGTWKGDPKQDIAGMTLPSQMVDWFNAAGIYSSVKNEANLATSAGIPQASDILNANGQDVVLLIHLNLMTGVLSATDSDGWLLRQFPNHWIVLLSEITQEATPTGPGKVDLSFWTWGDTHLAMDNSKDPPKHLIQIPQDQFIKYYFGSITATMNNAGS